MNLDNYEGHTPGPWHVCKISGGSAFGHLTVMMSNGQRIKQMYGMDGADARLIADAPDLLAFYLRVKEIMDMEEIEEIVRVELIWSVMQVMEGHWPKVWEEEE